MGDKSLARLEKPTPDTQSSFSIVTSQARSFLKDHSGGVGEQEAR